MFKVVDGQRSSLECEMIEAICLGNMHTYKTLIDRLNRRTNLSLLKTSSPIEQEKSHQEEWSD